MFLEDSNVKTAFAPVDLNTAAITGERVSVKDAERITVLLSLGTSLTGGVVQVTLRQHNASTVGTSKDLLSAKPYFHKISAASVFTQVVPGSAAALKDASAIFDISGGILAVEIDAQELDTNNGFNYFSVDLADGGVAKIGSAVYVMNEVGFKPAYAQAL